jgi:hypothetical protein
VLAAREEGEGRGRKEEEKGKREKEGKRKEEEKEKKKEKKGRKNRRRDFGKIRKIVRENWEGFCGVFRASAHSPGRR